MKAKKVEITYALINDGVVENIIVADDEFAEMMRGLYDDVVLANGTVAYVGGEYLDGEFVPRPVESAE